MQSKKLFYKNNKDDKVLWLDGGEIGENVFSFDKKILFNLFRDYPYKLSVREWMIFNKENPYWEEFFSERNEDYKIEHKEEIERIKHQGTQNQ